MLANRVHAASGQLEISRKDFEGSIERKIDLVLPYDQKLAAQAAKLGKPLAETGKNSKTVAPLVHLAQAIAGAADAAAADPKGKAGKDAKGKAGSSLIGKFDLKALIGKRGKK